MMPRAANTMALTRASVISTVCFGYIIATHSASSLTRQGLSTAPTVASFVRPTRPAEKGQSFIAALNEKYVGTDQEKESQPAQIVIGTKVAEEMGFDKIRRQMAELTEMKVAIVDCARVDKAVADGDASIQDTCPKIAQLDISRNLFESVGPVVDICAGLPALRKLAIKYVCCLPFMSFC